MTNSQDRVRFSFGEIQALIILCEINERMFNMKKIISVLLCLTLLCTLAVPAAHAADVPDAFLEAYADTDRGFVLVLTMDECVTGISDAFSVRIQKLQRNKEKLGYDIELKYVKREAE